MIAIMIFRLTLILILIVILLLILIMVLILILIMITILILMLFFFLQHTQKLNHLSLQFVQCSIVCNALSIAVFCTRYYSHFVVCNGHHHSHCYRFPYFSAVNLAITFSRYALSFSCLQPMYSLIPQSLLLATVFLIDSNYIDNFFLFTALIILLSSAQYML